MHPIIQLHVDKNGVKNTMAPTGTFNMFIFSEEMKNAIKYGYTFEIERGYYFT